jgi:hypothetical protein
MKRCPECASVFPDSDKFCELHGLPLISEDADSNLLSNEPETQQTLRALGLAETRRQSESKILAIGAVAGLVVAVLAFLIYRGFTQQAQTPDHIEVSSNTTNGQQLRPISALPPAVVEVSPSPEASPSPSPSASPSQSATPVRTALSSSAISTSGNEKTARSGVTIRLIDGNSIEADEAWETGEGIWYRRRGIVTLLQRDQVKAIDRTAPPPQSTPSSTPQSTPTQTPSP